MLEVTAQEALEKDLHLEVGGVEEELREAHVAAAGVGAVLHAAAAVFRLALVDNLAAGGFDHVLVVAQHFERRAILRQHIDQPGQRAFQLDLLVRLVDDVVVLVALVGIGMLLQLRQRSGEVGVVELLVVDDEGALVALRQLIVGGALNVGLRDRRVGQSRAR